ncbi:MAG TPA: alpha/beta hydrolase-fold protein [Chitinophagaceae bacterium]|nr:alpha/beta hydrolase-fold protein [Chitinophagaceae bacterium]
METEKAAGILTESHVLLSSYLEREVKLEVYFSTNVLNLADISLLLINDGQNLPEMKFENILENLYLEDSLAPLLCVGIHCGINRKNEYGTVGVLDYKGRGTKAAAYSYFIFDELIPFVKHTYQVYSFKEKSFCGFSLGALSALDIVWSNPKEFAKVGLFSGSLWWRTVDQRDELFDENIHRIMHMKIRNGGYYPWLKFFFETGTKDETADRNGNGIIDAIDDTISLVDELVLKGYDRNRDIKYLELKDGKHDIATWGKVFPEFLKWGWGKESR